MNDLVFSIFTGHPNKGILTSTHPDGCPFIYLEKRKMVIWVTVWVLTVQYSSYNNNNTSYQLTYGSQKVCEQQIPKHTKRMSFGTRCDFQQVPVALASK